MKNRVGKTQFNDWLVDCVTDELLFSSRMMSFIAISRMSVIITFEKVVFGENKCICVHINELWHLCPGFSPFLSTNLMIFVT